MCVFIIIMQGSQPWESLKATAPLRRELVPTCACRDILSPNLRSGPLYTHWGRRRLVLKVLQVFVLVAALGGFLCSGTVCAACWFLRLCVPSLLLYDFHGCFVLPLRCLAFSASGVTHSVPSCGSFRSRRLGLLCKTRDQMIILHAATATVLLS
jgi:hypothetical protein